MEVKCSPDGRDCSIMASCTRGSATSSPGWSRPGNLHWFCQGMSGSGSVSKTASILREMLKVFTNISCLIVWDRTIEDYLLMKPKQLFIIKSFQHAIVANCIFHWSQKQLCWSLTALCFHASNSPIGHDSGTPSRVNPDTPIPSRQLRNFCIIKLLIVSIL